MTKSAIIVEAIFWILLAIFAYQLLLKITGHSPTDFTILYTGFGVMAAYLFTATYNIASFVGRVDEFMSNTKTSFKNMKEDFRGVKNELKDVKEDVSNLKSRLLR